MVSEALAELRNMDVKIGNRTIVDHLSLTLNQGQILGLIGVNGAGKSTAIRSLLGLQPWDSGELLLRGNPCNPRDVKWKNSVAFIPDEPKLYDEMSTWEHLHWIAIGYSIENWEEKAEWLLQQVGLISNKNQSPSKFSKGMKQRLQIAMAQMHDADIIAADEPFLGLDPYAITYISSLFNFLKYQNKSLLITTHELHIAETLCDHFLILRDGKTLAKGTKQDIAMMIGFPLRSSLTDLFFAINESNQIEENF